MVRPSPAELETIRAAAVGELTTETAARLGVSYETVKYQRARAIRKLGARNIANAVAVALDAGYISVDAHIGGLL